MQIFFLHASIALGISILIYLWYFLSNRRIAEHYGINSFIPLLTKRQSNHFFIGFLVWTLTLAIHCVRLPESNYFSIIDIQNTQAFFDLLFHALMLSVTMSFGHAMVYFAVMPDERDGTVPELRSTHWHHVIGIALLAVISIALLVMGQDATVRGVLLGYLFPLWHLIIILNTGWKILSCVHPVRGAILLFLPVWVVTVLSGSPPAAWTNFPAMLVLLFIILRTNFLYVQDTFRRAFSFKSQKDVMISYLSKLGEDEMTAENVEAPDETAPAAVGSFLGGFNLDRMLTFTLQYGMELCDASAGVIYVRDDMQNLFVDDEQKLRKSKWLTVHDVIGPYPPAMELGYQANLKDRLDFIQDAVRSEKVGIGEGIAGSVAQTGQPALIVRALEDDRIQQQHEDFLRIRTLLAIPLKVQDRTIAVLSLINKNGGREGFTPNDEATLVSMADQAAITIGSAILHNDLQEKERLEREIEFAREVQRLLLPKKTPTLPNYDIAAMSRSAQDVGGDYYDYVHIDNERLAVVIADVSGKGFPAALTMASVRSAFRSLCKPGKCAKEILTELNGFIAPDMKRGMFVTMYLAIVNNRNNSVELVRAGHDPLVLYRKDGDKISILSPPGVAVGMIQGDFFGQQTEMVQLELQADDLLLLYTDGVTEAMNINNQEFSIERLRRLVERRHTLSAEELVNALRDEITSFSAGTRQYDDQTLVAVKFKGDASPT